MLWKGTIQRIWNLAMMKCLAWCTATPTPTATGHAPRSQRYRDEDSHNTLNSTTNQDSEASESKETNCFHCMFVWFASWLTTLKQFFSALKDWLTALKQCVSALPGKLKHLLKYLVGTSDDTDCQHDSPLGTKDKFFLENRELPRLVRFLVGIFFLPFIVSAGTFITSRAKGFAEIGEVTHFVCDCIASGIPIFLATWRIACFPSNPAFYFESFTNLLIMMCLPTFVSLAATLSKTGGEFKEDEVILLKTGYSLARLVLAVLMLVILLSALSYKYFKGNSFNKSLTGYLFKGSLMNAESYFDEHYFPDNRTKYTQRDIACQKFAKRYEYGLLDKPLKNSDFLKDLAYLHAIPARITGKPTDRIQGLGKLCPEIKETVPEMYWKFITYKYCWFSLSGSEQVYFEKRMKAIKAKEAKKNANPECHEIDIVVNIN